MSAKSRKSLVWIAGAILLMGMAGLAPYWCVVSSSGPGHDVLRTRSLLSENGPLAMAVETFRLDLGRRPRDLDELRKPAENGADVKWQGPYVSPNDTLEDSWGNTVHYSPGNETKGEPYNLWSNGPDGLEGTVDDIRYASPSESRSPKSSH